MGRIFQGLKATFGTFKQKPYKSTAQIEIREDEEFVFFTIATGNGARATYSRKKKDFSITEAIRRLFSDLEWSDIFRPADSIIIIYTTNWSIYWRIKLGVEMLIEPIKRLKIKVKYGLLYPITQLDLERAIENVRNSNHTLSPGRE